MDRPTRRRRSSEIRSLLREALVDLTKGQPFEEITVSRLCEHAEVSRSAFYRQYRNTAEVLDEVLEEALSSMGTVFELLEDDNPFESPACSTPFCHFIRKSERYRGIFFDDGLTERILDKFVKLARAKLAVRSGEQTVLSVDDRSDLLYFQLSGCLSLTKSSIALSDEEWEKTRRLVDRFIRGGLEAALHGASL